jgi:hypothetical protein
LGQRQYYNMRHWRFWLGTETILQHETLEVLAWDRDKQSCRVTLSDCHDITEILLKVALNTIKQAKSFMMEINHFKIVFIFWW